MATLAELERALTDLPDDSYRVGMSRQRPATEAEVAALEATLGWPLPPDLRALYRAWGALIVEAKEEVWPRPRELDVLPAWRFDPGLVVLGPGANLPPALTIAAARSAEMTAHGELPWLRRTGGLTIVLTATGSAVIERDGTREPWTAAPIAIILDELQRLAEGVATLRLPLRSTAELVADGAAASWTGPTATRVLDALPQRPAAELVALAPALIPALTGATHVMGALDVIAAAGPAGLAAVADVIYGLGAGRHRGYVLELLGKVGAAEPRALAAYRAGLADDDDEVVEHALDAIAAIAAHPEATALIDAVAAVATSHGEVERRHQALGVLGHLGDPALPGLVTAALDDLTDDELADLLGELADVPAAIAPVLPALVARARTATADGWAGLAIVEALLRLGARDASWMAPLARQYQARGAGWATRAQAVLDQL